MLQPAGESVNMTRCTEVTILKFKYPVAAAVFAVVLTACSSSSEPMAVEFVVPLSLGSGQVTGQATDEGMICTEGTLTRLKMENSNGELITEEEGMRLWDEAAGSGATLEMILYEEFNCSDGSGSISLLSSNVVQPSALDFDGANDVGTWEIQSGTGKYEGYSGEGTMIADFGAGFARYAGEIREG